ncbi:hypothetical protein [Rhodoblastus sp.]|uniref:hypothetical protein n=1 Tax=Rhodoblastus sp. TaxID=1962975 RepID=UPI002604232C|nr:hypothetical protein [Rhodoblastus sp.]
MSKSTTRAASLAVEMVDDPQRPGEKAPAVVRRANGLDHLKSHGRLTEAQAHAGEAFVKLYELANGPNLRALDYGRVRVDGGRRDYGPGNARFKALQTLLETREAIGERSFYLIAQIGGKGRSLSDVAGEVAKEFGMSASAARAYVPARLTEALDALAGHWGATGPARAKMRAERFDTMPAA